MVRSKENNQSLRFFTNAFMVCHSTIWHVPIVRRFFFFHFVILASFACLTVITNGINRDTILAHTLFLEKNMYLLVQFSFNIFKTMLWL